MENKIADCIHTKEIHQFICIKHISFGLTHLAITLKQPRMSEDLLRKGQIQRHQEYRPVDSMETDNVFSDEMQVCRPVLFKLFRALSVTVITNPGNIVCKGIEPYIYDMLRIKVNRDSPFKRSSGYTKVLKSRKKEIVHHFIFSGNRLYKFRMSVDVLN